MNISSIKPIPQQHQSKVAIGLLLAVVSVIGFAACSASSSQQGAFPTREEAGVQQQAPADTTVDLEDAEVREYLANAFRSLDAVDQDGAGAIEYEHCQGGGRPVDGDGRALGDHERAQGRERRRERIGSQPTSRSPAAKSSSSSLSSSSSRGRRSD